MGCTDPAACNYDPAATLSSAALCTYPSIPFLNCDGGCVNDADSDGVCDEQEIPGCTDPKIVVLPVGVAWTADYRKRKWRQWQE